MIDQNDLPAVRTGPAAIPARLFASDCEQAMNYACSEGFGMGKSKAAKSAEGLVDPTKLKPFTKKAKESTAETAEGGDKLVQVIIETPKGSHNKYSFDTEQKIFELKAALPSGMVFPYDFGFVPGTLADDGDPLDVLVLMDEPAFPGCAIVVRLIGVIEGDHKLQGKKYKLIARKGEKTALKLIAEARKKAHQ